MTVHELMSDEEIAAAFPLMAELRERVERSRFLPAIRRQQIEGYRLFAGSEGGELAALGGVRRTHTLARGEHLFVDDLVVAARFRGRGHGRSMMQWLGRWAAAQGLSWIYLDSRDSAEGFYRKVGFEMRSSIPCGVEIDKLVKGGC